MRAKDALGRYGERLASRHLEAAGYTVLARNWRSPERDAPGELDLVALIGEALVVVEVKTRRHDGCGSPLEAVTPRKLQQVRKLTAVWLAAARAEGVDLPPLGSVRIDVVAVRVPRSGAASVVHLRGVG
jgi:putative endonuclease